MQEQDIENTKYLINKPYKSWAAAILLTLFLGPFGLLYGNFLGAIIMTVIMIVGLIIPKGGAVILLIIWLICPFWCVWSVSRYNLDIS